MIPTDFAACLIMSTDTQSHIFISAQQIAIYIIVLAQKLYSSYCINYTSFPEPLNSLYPSIFNGFTLLHHIPELHQ